VWWLVWLFAADRWETPGLAVQVRLRPEVSVAHAGEAELEVGHRWGGVRLTGVPGPFAEALHRLAEEWQDPRQLTASLVAEPGTVSGAASLGRFLWLCEELAFLVQVRLALDDGPLLTIEPTSRAAHLPLEGWTGPPGAILSPFAFFRLVDDDVVLESAVANHRVVVHDQTTWLTLAGLGRGLRLLETELDGLLLQVLAGTGMLRGTETESSGLDTVVIGSAEAADLLLHQRSRFGTHDGGFGAEFPFLGTLDPPPAFPPPIAADALPLPVPDEQVVRARDLSLTQALESRCSVREHSHAALSLGEVAEFLFRCARVRGHYGPAPEAGMPYVAIDRAVPSGGGMHELELYLVAANVERLPVGVYHYRARDHALEPLDTPPSAVAALLEAAVRASATQASPPVLIKITSRFHRVAWKYRAIAYATTLKNVGALYQTMYLVATSMGLAPCALGSGDEVAGRLALAGAAAGELGVGEFMLGHLPSPTAREDLVAYRRGQPTWQDDVAPGWGRLR
jgi:SagB-type dehydrogenase family enzyme